MRPVALVASLLLAACGKPSGVAAADPPPPTPQEKPAPAAPAAKGVDWPRFLGPTADGKSPETGVQWPPREVWSRPLGESYGGPTTSAGRLFLFDQNKDKARLSCLKSRTGEELWSWEYETDYVDMYGYAHGPRCCPVVDGDRVYVYGVEGTLACLKAADGTEVWRKNLNEEYGVVQNFFGVGSTPLVEGDLLIVQVGGSPPGSPGVRTGRTPGNGSGIVAFDKKTGKEKYRITDELASYSSPAAATIGDRRWCFVFARGGLVGFEPATGKVDFHFPWRAGVIESVNAANPVVVGDRVLISECYGVGSALLRVKPGGYDVVWEDGRRRDRSLMMHWSTPIHVDGHVYGSSGRHSREAELRCVEFDTGKVKWREPGLTRTSLLHVDGRFVCLGEDGVLRLLKPDPEKYVEVARIDRPLVEYPAWAAPVLSHGLLYIRGKGRLRCLELIPAE